MLCELLKDHLEPHYDDPLSINRIPNGCIDHTEQISIALWYLAGGQAMDIVLVHDISHAEVFESIWLVVDAINQHPELSINFPRSHDEQLQLANDFCRKHQAGFTRCMGAIDGMLVWIHKPSKHNMKLTKLEQKSFFCGRKKKFGLNMQAVCDAQWRLLDVYIGHPGSTPNFLSFMTSPLHCHLEEPNFLHLDLCLFGDNAYVNTNYMVTPYKAASGGSKDVSNFYQSQLRICIECALSMLCHRVAILHKPIPQKITTAKTTALVMACCKLHNICINNNDTKVPIPREGDMC
jgi:DDE superfamily endonuclease